MCSSRPLPFLTGTPPASTNIDSLSAGDIQESKFYSWAALEYRAKSLRRSFVAAGQAHAKVENAPINPHSRCLQ